MRQNRASDQPKTLDDIALAYTHLVLAMGQHDADYVDAFYGPAEWKTQAEKEKKPLDAIREEAMDLFAQLAAIAVPDNPHDQLRLASLSQANSPRSRLASVS
jgi:hypothetical protein